MMAAEKRQFDFQNGRSVQPNIANMLYARGGGGGRRLLYGTDRDARRKF